MSRLASRMMLGTRRFLCSMLVTLLPLCVAAQDNVLKVEFEGDPSRSTVIGAFQRQGILFGSANDLAQILALGTFENTSARKLEIKHAPYRLKLSGGNPFVVLTDVGPGGSARQTIIQLPAQVIFAAGAFFVPLESFVPLLNPVSGTRIVLDRATRTLRIGAPISPAAVDIPTLSLEPKANGMLVRIPCRKAGVDFESWLRQDGWLYVTVADVTADTAAINRLAPVGLVREIIAIQSPTSLQLTFRLSGKIASSEILRHSNAQEILLSIRTPTVDERKLLEKRQREIQEDLENQRRRWELDVIVLDPGHGGKDGGAVGVTGVKEKDVTLGIARKLGRLIKKNLKGVQVVYTRTGDSFVELHRRGQIANEAGGKLFISIHCNALNRKPSPTRGFEVYLLRPGKTEDAIAIAERENAVIQLEEGYEDRYQQLSEENFILVAMAQSAYVKASEMFADMTQQEMERKTSIPNRGVKQAGFYVLVGAAMPNILIETAYLSNREDERFLRSDTGQQKIAESLFRAIRKYKEEYEKLLKEGKEISEIK